MINTSNAYREAILDERNFLILDTITLLDGTVRQLSVEDVLEYSVSDATSSDNSFDIGAAVAKKHTLTLDNTSRFYDHLKLGGATIDAKIGLLLEDDSVEVIRKGIFFVTKAYKSGKTIKIESYDGLIAFNRPYSESQLAYPATLQQIVTNACSDCGVLCEITSLRNGSYVISKRPEDGALTYRDIIASCAQIMCQYARVDNEGVLRFAWYDFDIFASGNAHGGWFDEASPYGSGDNLDGGTFDPWSDGDFFDSGYFYNMGGAHSFTQLLQSDINEEDVVVTGVNLVETDTNNNYQYGEDGYVLEISGNPFITTDNLSYLAAYIGDLVIGSQIRPMTLSIRSDPSVEAGDPAIITDNYNEAYQTVITSTVFNFWNAQAVACNAETLEENSISGYGSMTKAIVQSRRYASDQLSEYDKTVILMTKLISQGFGLYFLQEEQTDGSTTYYLCDKPNLEESSVVWKLTANGLMVSRNKGTTWAVDSNGNALFNVVSTKGLIADWIRGGTFTVGGVNNQYGEINVIDADGNIAGVINTNGISLISDSDKWRGIFSGYMQSDSSRAQYFELTDDYEEFYGRPWLDARVIGGDGMVDIEGALISTKEVTYTPSPLILGGDPFPGRCLSLDISEYWTTDSDIGNEFGFIIFSNSDRLFEISPDIDGSTDRILRIYTDTYAMRGTSTFDEVIASGTKSRVVNDTAYGNRRLYCYETPTPYFGDIGTGRTDESGCCYVSIDSIFAETANTEIEYTVFLQKEGPGDIWVEEKTSAYFVVKGTANLPFSWELKAVQTGYETYRLEEDTRFKADEPEGFIEEDYSEPAYFISNDFNVEEL